jgi:membrane protein implicated in regulation of membrane protease activity
MLLRGVRLDSCYSISGQYASTSISDNFRTQLVVMLAIPVVPSAEGFAWVLAVALTVLFLDVFFSTDFLSIAALLGIAVYGALLLNISGKWTILIALLSWLASMAIFYTLWKRVVMKVILNLFGTGLKETIHSAQGQTGQFREIEGRHFVSWNGELWPAQFDSKVSFSDMQPVLIEKVETGIFTISHLE